MGFWYQSLYALLTLLQQTTDNASIGIEALDDVELQADGRSVLYQLKHSISANPPPTTIKSKSLWKTIKVWIDVLPSIELSETKLHLVTVGDIPSSDPLYLLTDPESDRKSLTGAMVSEARRVIDERVEATKAGKPLPHAERYKGCQAFLDLNPIKQINLVRCIFVKPGSPRVNEIENNISQRLDIISPSQRPVVTTRLVEWWDRQVLYSLSGQRERVIFRTEILDKLGSIIADIDHGRLTPEFEILKHPENYQPDSMLFAQIALVNGKPSDLTRAIREEWRAREQRASWVSYNPSMAVEINDYDLVLIENWSDKHTEIVEDYEETTEDKKQEAGLELLRWSHNIAPNVIRPITQTWNAPYYVRGSYQVLAINLKVGWHPEYKERLEDK